MKKMMIVGVLLAASVMMSVPVMAAPPAGGNVKAKFYDFSDQLIDGEVKRPTALYTDVRQQASFKRLLRLKKSFIKDVLQRTARDPAFK